MDPDPYINFKAAQREGWALFAPLETLTTPPAGALVEFARIARDEQVKARAPLDDIVALAAFEVVVARIAVQLVGV